MRPLSRIATQTALSSVIFAGMLLWSRAAEASPWEAAAALGADQWFTPEFAGHAFAIFDLRGRGLVGGGDLHVNYNTETVQLSVERIPVANRRIELSAGLRAEGLVAGVLRYYYQGGLQVRDRGFLASHLTAFTSVKWLPAEHHSFEVVGTGRRWFFGREGGATNPGLSTPPDTFVFEPRLRYTFWNLRAPEGEWQAHVLYQRVEGLAFGVELGADLRSDPRAWGSIGAMDDARNRPGEVILMARQWLRAGAQFSPALRVQIDQTASWGVGEDDLTRVRVGGMNPYVVQVPGIAWPALLCERLVAAQVSLHVRPSPGSRHELGAALAGGAFNDVRRVGDLNDFGAAGGAALFTDLRFGRWVFHLRGGYGFPTSWLAPGPNLSAAATAGVRFF